MGASFYAYLATLIVALSLEDCKIWSSMIARLSIRSPYMQVLTPDTHAYSADLTVTAFQGFVPCIPESSKTGSGACFET
eukprot:5163871-Amphidinium_carterae.1